MLIPASPARPYTFAEFGAALTGVARFETGPFLAVAVSGGPDSLALAILADRWTRQAGGEVCALTVDHGLRPESGNEIRQLQGWLSARAVRHEILIWSGAKPMSGIQQAARAARYRLLTEWCRRHGCLHLLTAHHREDQAETHLIRRRAGSGPDGLAGMSAIRELSECRLLRPLLGVAKSRLTAFLNEEGQPFINDPSNRDLSFERSWLRRADGAMPDGANFSVLLAGVRALGYERAARESERNALMARAVAVHPAGFACLDLASILAASREIAERVLSAVAVAIGGSLYPVRRARVARLHEALTNPACKGHTLGGCRFVPWRERILVFRELAGAAGAVRLTPGASLLWDRRFDLMLPAAANGAVTIGYLGRSGVAELNRRIPRLRSSTSLPRLLSPILPTVWDEEGIAAVPHLGFKREGVETLPHVVFRPVNPMTWAGFRVV